MFHDHRAKGCFGPGSKSGAQQGGEKGGCPAVRLDRPARSHRPRWCPTGSVPHQAPRHTRSSSGRFHSVKPRQARLRQDPRRERTQEMLSVSMLDRVPGETQSRTLQGQGRPVLGPCSRQSIAGSGFGEATAHFKDQRGRDRLAHGSSAVGSTMIAIKHSGTEAQREQSLSV